MIARTLFLYLMASSKAACCVWLTAAVWLFWAATSEPIQVVCGEEQQRLTLTDWSRLSCPVSQYGGSTVVFAQWLSLACKTRIRSCKMIQHIKYHSCMARVNEVGTHRLWYSCRLSGASMTFSFGPSHVSGNFSLSPPIFRGPRARIF